LGLAVNRLIRVSFGPFQLGEIEEGALVEAPTRVVREQIGPRLAREAGADFEAPLREKKRAEPAAKPRGERPRGDRRAAPERGRGDRRFAGEGDRLEPREAPRRDERRPPKGRKYFTTIRAEGEKAERGPRRRSERGAVSDRKGRTIE